MMLDCSDQNPPCIYVFFPVFIQCSGHPRRKLNHYALRVNEYRLVRNCDFMQLNFKVNNSVNFPYFDSLNLYWCISQKHVGIYQSTTCTLCLRKRPPFSYDCIFYKCWPIFTIFGTQYTELMCNITIIYLFIHLTYMLLLHYLGKSRM